MNIKVRDWLQIQNQLREMTNLTYRKHDTLVGFLLAMTDYGFDCYLNDLAVDKAYQHQGIGRTLLQELRTLLQELRTLLGDEVMILLSSARDAVDFYHRNGFSENRKRSRVRNYSAPPF